MSMSAARSSLLHDGEEHTLRRLRWLERIYDPATTRRLDHLGVGPGWRCLEVGAGGGSITRWLCSRVGTAGRVMAVDVDTRFVSDIRAVNLDVARLDVTTAALPREAFDLIHVRSLLSHLPEREAVLDALVGLLAPRGWLLVEDPDGYATGAFGPGLHGQMLAKMTSGAAGAGFDPTWARDLPARLHQRGLADIAAESELPLIEGGSPPSDLFRLVTPEDRDRAIAAGATAEELDQWNALLDTPAQWLPGLAMVAAWGRWR